MRNLPDYNRFQAVEAIDQRLTNMLQAMPVLIESGLITKEKAQSRYFALETLMCSLMHQKIREDHRQPDEIIIEELDRWASELIEGWDSGAFGTVPVKIQIAMIEALKSYVNEGCIIR